MATITSAKVSKSIIRPVYSGLLIPLFKIKSIKQRLLMVFALGCDLGVKFGRASVDVSYVMMLRQSPPRAQNRQELNLRCM